MLFDLRGRHRRRAVRVIYIGLALLIGVGLVGFGIGGGFGGGGLLSAATSNEGSGSTSYAKQIAKYRALVRKYPQNAGYWENLTRQQLHEAGGEAFVTNTGLTSAGHKLFNEVSSSWNSYLHVTKKPNLELTKTMLRIYSEEGLNQPNQETALLEILVGAEPNNASYYGALAEYAYKGHSTNLGDLAAAKAVALSPASQRTRVKNELAELKKSVEKEAKESTSSTSTPSGVKTGTITTKGITTGTVTAPEGTVITK